MKINIDVKMSLKCVNCGRKATMGSLSHPYCKSCWDKLWKGREDQYVNWLKYHETILGMLWYKKNILKHKLSFWDRFLLRILK